jgi:hypothetical protein
MKSLLNVMNKNLGTNFKTVAEYGANADKIDMKIVAETLYQYMLYQETIDRADIDSFKVKLKIKKDK